MPFSPWSLPKLADFLVAEGVVDDINHEGLRIRLREKRRQGSMIRRYIIWRYRHADDQRLRAVVDGSNVA